MKIYCLGLVIVCLFIYLQINPREGIKEGFTVPKRHIPDDLKAFIKTGVGDLSYTPDQTSLFKKETDIEKKYKPRHTASALAAKMNLKLCQDTDRYHSCKIDSDISRMNKFEIKRLPPRKVSSSNIYNHLSICPQAYQNNIDILNKKKSTGQYAGYTDNNYIDRTRYVKSKEPLPVNPDFFLEGGGTFA